MAEVRKCPLGHYVGFDLYAKCRVCSGEAKPLIRFMPLSDTGKRIAFKGIVIDFNKKI